MNMSVTDYKKPIAIAVCLLMLLSGLAVLMADSSSATQDDEVVKEGDYFYLNDVVYKITSVDGTQGEVSVSGLTHEHDVEIVVAASFEYEDVTYLVTGIQPDALKNKADDGVTSLVLPTTLTRIGAGALDNCCKNGNFVIPAVYGPEKDVVIVPYTFHDLGDEMDAKTYFPDYKTYADKFIDVTTSLTVQFHINIYSRAELNATNIADFEKDGGFYIQTFYGGVLNKIWDCEYTREYFECSGWSFTSGDPVPEDNIVFDDGASVMIDEFEDHMELYAAWEETNPCEDYPEWMMWATVGIIIALAVVGISMMVYRSRQASA